MTYFVTRRILQITYLLQLPVTAQPAENVAPSLHNRRQILQEIINSNRKSRAAKAGSRPAMDQYAVAKIEKDLATSLTSGDEMSHNELTKSSRSASEEASTYAKAVQDECSRTSTRSPSWFIPDLGASGKPCTVHTIQARRARVSYMSSLFSRLNSAGFSNRIGLAEKIFRSRLSDGKLAEADTEQSSSSAYTNGVHSLDAQRLTRLAPLESSLTPEHTTTEQLDGHEESETTTETPTPGTHLDLLFARFSSTASEWPKRFWQKYSSPARILEKYAQRERYVKECAHLGLPINYEDSSSTPMVGKCSKSSIIAELKRRDDEVT